MANDPGLATLRIDGYAPSVPVRPGTGALLISGIPTQAGTLYSYATIVGGIVTALSLYSVSIPASTLTTLYYDITNYSPLPSIGDYFDEVCQVFSGAPFPIPPGTVVPPVYPPPPPIVTDPPIITDPPINSILDTLIPVLVPFAADPDDGTVVTNMPSTRTEIQERSWTPFDLTRCYSARVQAYVEAAGNGNSVIAVEYSSDRGSTWLPLDTLSGPWCLVESLGDQRGPDAPLDPLARTDVLLRVVTDQGDGAADLTLGNYALMCYMTFAQPPVFPPPPGVDLPTGCGIATAWPQYIDFAHEPPLPTVTIADFYEWVFRYGKYVDLSPQTFPLIANYWADAVANSNVPIIDINTRWHGHPTMRGNGTVYTVGVGQVPINNSLYFDNNPSDGGVQGVTEDYATTDTTDMWGRMRLKFPAGFETNGRGAPGDGVRLFYEFASTDDYMAFGFSTETDEVYVFPNGYSGAGSGTAVGVASRDILGQGWIEVGYHYKQVAGTVTIDFYLGTPCSALTIYGTVSGPEAAGGWDTGDEAYLGHNQYYYYDGPEGWPWTDAVVLATEADRYFWLGDVQDFIPEATYPNPFGYA